jgi:hypothetical protein
MSELTMDIAALEELPEIESIELGGHGGGGSFCGLITCVVSCLVTILAL